MNQYAVLFPGQGSQYIGMFDRVARQYPEADKIWEQANDILGLDLKKMVSEGNMKELTLSKNGQPAVVTASQLFYLTFQKTIQQKAAFFIGHSLGEISAYIAAGALSFEEGLSFVRARGEIMDQAISEERGEAGIVVDMEEADLRKLVDDTRTEAYITISGYNSPRQFVVAGTREGMQILDQNVDKAGTGQLIPFRMIPMKANAPYHSILMNNLVQELETEVNKMAVKDPEIPIYSTVTGEIINSRSKIADILKKQLTSPILWNQALNGAVSRGVETFIDIGPGETIKNLVDEHKKMPVTVAFEHQLEKDVES